MFFHRNRVNAVSIGYDALAQGIPAIPQNMFLVFFFLHFFFLNLLFQPIPCDIFAHFKEQKQSLQFRFHFTLKRAFQVIQEPAILFQYIHVDRYFTNIDIGPGSFFSRFILFYLSRVAPHVRFFLSINLVEKWIHPKMLWMLAGWFWLNCEKCWRTFRFAFGERVRRDFYGTFTFWVMCTHCIIPAWIVFLFFE